MATIRAKNKKTISRKAKEIILSLELDRRYSKNQILEWYLNQIPFGPNIYGVEEAARSYFNKSAKDLTLAESALLASTIKAPSFYWQHRQELLKRKDDTLRKMLENNFISQEEYQKAKSEAIANKEKYKKEIEQLKAELKQTKEEYDKTYNEILTKLGVSKEDLPSIKQKIDYFNNKIANYNEMTDNELWAAKKEINNLIEEYEKYSKSNYAKVPDFVANFSDLNNKIRGKERFFYFNGLAISHRLLNLLFKTSMSSRWT